MMIMIALFSHDPRDLESDTISEDPLLPRSCTT